MYDLNCIVFVNQTSHVSLFIQSLPRQTTFDDNVLLLGWVGFFYSFISKLHYAIVDSRNLSYRVHVDVYYTTIHDRRFVPNTTILQ